MKSTKQPFLVYFYPYLDSDLREKSKYPQDHVCCVMADNSSQAIKLSERIAQKAGSPYIKVMGIAKGREEWVNHELPLRQQERGSFGGLGSLNNKNI